MHLIRKKSRAALGSLRDENSTKLLNRYTGSKELGIFSCQIYKMDPFKFSFYCRWFSSLLREFHWGNTNPLGRMMPCLGGEIKLYLGIFVAMPPLVRWVGRRRMCEDCNKPVNVLLLREENDWIKIQTKMATKLWVDHETFIFFFK